MTMFRFILGQLRRRGIYVFRNGMPWGASLPRDLQTLPAFPATPVIFDVGANVGQTLMEVKNAWPKAIVHCFEPTPESFKLLSQAAAKLCDVTCHEIALSSKGGTAVLTRGDVYVLNQVKPIELTCVSSVGVMERTCVRLSTVGSMCQDANIAHIDLLKIDTEGHDLQVLMGAERLLNKHAIDFVLTEVGFGDDARFCLDIEIRDYMMRFGYRLLGVYGQSPAIDQWNRSHVPPYYANMLFIRPHYFSADVHASYIADTSYV